MGQVKSPESDGHHSAVECRLQMKPYPRGRLKLSEVQSCQVGPQRTL